MSAVGLDLFCGAGGMSLGFESAGVGVSAAVDVWAQHREVYALNHPDTEVLDTDLSAPTQKILDAIPPAARKSDIVFGGPPCQGFSVGGKQQFDDSRNSLLQSFARIVAEIEPRVFVVENVSGLLAPKNKPHLDRFIKFLKRCGYAFPDTPYLLDAAQFGIPQRRKRVFLIGRRGPAGGFPNAPNKVNNQAPDVWDAIGDLSVVDEHPDSVTEGWFYGPPGTASEYVKLLARTFPRPALIRTHAVSGFLSTVHSPATVARFRATRPGTREPVTRFLRLKKDGLAPTLRAGTGPERGSFMAPRPIHPEAPRCIFVREAARLHSYPDWYRFHETKWYAFMQIGNSVPPLLAQAIARLAVRLL